MPDLSEATSIALNVIPITPESYGPFPSLSTYSSNAMDGQCIGAICTQSQDLSVYLFAGTSDKLYDMTATAPTWMDVSGTSYSTAVGDGWEFDLFNESVIATNFGDPLQSFTMGVSTVFGPLFTAPAWAQATAYSTLGQYVLANGNRYVLVEAGTSAASGTGPSGTGAGIIDGATAATAWQNGTAYSLIGERVSANGNIYTLVTAGTSSISGTGPTGTGTGIIDGLVETAWAPATAYATLGQEVEANHTIYALSRVGTSAVLGTGPAGIGDNIADGISAPVWTTFTAYVSLGARVTANGNVYTLTTVGTSAPTGTGPSGTGSSITDGLTIGAWTGSHSYTVLGTLVSNGGNVYELIQTGVSASSGGPTGTTWGIVDGTCKWDFIAASWAPATTYGVVGTEVFNGGNLYVLTQTGTSAGSGGPTTVADGIADNTCVWNYVAGAAAVWSYYAPQAALWNYVGGAAAVWNYASAQAAIWDYQSGAPPQARHMCTPKNFLMVGNTSDPVGGEAPQRVRWSASGDATSWPAPGSNAAIEAQSDYNDFKGNFGSITGLVDSLANADVAIFFQHAVWRGLYTGPPVVFEFFPCENARGCPAPNSIIPLGTIVWYLGEDGFYMFDGATSTPIGADKFDNWFWSNVNQNYLWNVIGAANVPSKLVMWAFPSTAAPGGIPDTILLYRWDIGRASYISVGSNGVEWLLRALTWGVTMDGMPALGYTDTDTLPASLDSAIWVGGALQLAAVSGSHQLGYFTGPNMAAQVATQTKQLTPGRRSYVQSARPLVDLSQGTPSIAFSARVDLYDPEVFGAAIAPDVSGECPQRSDGRYHGAMVEIPAGAIWTHIIGVDTTFIPSGFR